MTEQAQQDFVTVTIDGIELQAPRNAMIIEVADRAGIAIPRFCYHKHLSIAANCRMCMVEVEKVPKPLPACATPISDGMKISTRSDLALDAQKGTMEFLLINHPLDCPVCDQGGECELQDIAMGYGSDISRFTERKRVVKDKNIGPLVSTDMTRCIHCTRCVRFGAEIAGLRELGATGRGEFMEIGTFVEKSLSSELSGNVIDLCPVGALNAKPSRMRGRAWEMVEASAISPHDAVGSNLSMHVIRNEVIRVVPKENSEVNETWISDRDRFSYEALYSDARLHQVRKKVHGKWQTCGWSDALKGIGDNLRKYAPEDIGILVSPNQSNEEIFLLQKLARAMRINNIDHRVQQIDFSDQDNDPLLPWLGLSITELEQQETIVLIGSDLRNEHPMLMHRVRKAAMQGAKIVVINPIRTDLYLDPEVHEVVAPQEWCIRLLQLIHSIGNISKPDLPQPLIQLLEKAEIDTRYENIALVKIAHLLNSNVNTCVLVGNLMQQHPEYATLRALAYWIAHLNDSKFGYIPLASNAAGAAILGALPHRAAMSENVDEPGLTYREMVQSPRKLYIVVGLEPEWDCALPAATVRALEEAEQVVSLTSFVSEAMQEYSDWLLPISCHAETEGTKINLEGRWQRYSKVVQAKQGVKDLWKILRMLATELGLHNFDYFNVEDIRLKIAAEIDASASFSNELKKFPQVTLELNNGDELYRTGNVPIYSIDSLVRHAPSLQQAQELEDAVLMMHSADVKKYGLIVEKWVRVTQDGEKSILKCVVNDDLKPGTAYIPRGLVRSEKLGALFGQIELKSLSV